MTFLLNYCTYVVMGLFVTTCHMHKVITVQGRRVTFGVTQYKKRRRKKLNNHQREPLQNLTLEIPDDDEVLERWRRYLVQFRRETLGTISLNPAVSNNTCS